MPPIATALVLQGFRPIACSRTSGRMPQGRPRGGRFGTDAAVMRELIGIDRVSAIPTGVDVESLTPPDPRREKTAGLMFVGIHGLDCPTWNESNGSCGKCSPDSARLDCLYHRWAHATTVELSPWAWDGRIRVTGTVPDIRPLLWSAAVSIVPLRIGGGHAAEDL